MKLKLCVLLFLCVFSSELFSQGGLIGGFELSCDLQDSRNVYDYPIYLEEGFKDNIRAVVRYNMGSLCTGTLLNQITSDNQQKQYLLTANHCVNDADFSKKWDFYFNYQSPNASNSSVPSSFPGGTGNIYGQWGLHVSSVRLVNRDGLTDVALIEIIDPIPPHFDPYYSGWSISLTGSLAGNTKVIHHPKGDIKKYATIGNTLPNAPNLACHTVTEIIQRIFRFFTRRQINIRKICNITELPYYTALDYSRGVVETGSSGSALLNNNNRAIGTLYRGTSNCDIAVGDIYGKLYLFYQTNGVKNALNPRGYLTSHHDGRNMGCYHRDPLVLNGRYYPAKYYQPDNRVVIKAAGLMRLGEGTATDGWLFTSNPPTTGLIIYPEADFAFQAGNAIEFVSGFDALAGSTFDTKIAGCGSGFRTEIAEKNPHMSTYDEAWDLFHKAPAPVSYTSSHVSRLKPTIYPNPSSGTEVTLKFENYADTKITVTIYDVAMRDISTIIDNKVYEAGAYEVPFQTSGFAPGMYLCKISNGNISETIKFSVVK